MSGVRLPSGDFSDRGLRYLIVAGIGSFIFVCALLLLVFMGARLPFGTLIIDLGFRKWQASRGERLMSFQQTMNEDDYRARIAAARARLAAMGVSSA